MKLVNLVTTTLFLLVVSQPLASPDPKSSHVWIGLNVDQCLIDANTTPSPKYVPPRAHPRRHKFHTDLSTIKRLASA
ncbi:hypothetical protein AA0117_g12343 [Alternaria alternata]|uniref:Uncharacterized protein n=1 Tax=Alternaria alternata TaxID=5599 RepID=A0A4Q4MZD4_ALTAL|nr:hypothetical protein AA0117_g12343 [Alternaria alternata]